MDFLVFVVVVGVVGFVLYKKVPAAKKAIDKVLTKIGVGPSA